MSLIRSDEDELRELANLRDIGGLPTENGGRTRFGILYRSDAPMAGDRLAPSPRPWPPPTVIDLRSVTERARAPHPLGAIGASVHHIPLFPDLDPSAFGRTRQDRPRLLDLYLELLAVAGPAFAQVLDVAASAPSPVLVHCAAGKDRTGVIVALLLRAAGVTRPAVVEDYTRTATNLPRLVARFRLAGRPVLDEHADLMSSPAAAIEQVLDAVESHSTGVIGWLREQGADDATLTTWASRVIGTGTHDNDER